MKKLNKTKQAVRHFVERGGRVSHDGKFVFGPSKKELSKILSKRGSVSYFFVNVMLPKEKISRPVGIHRIVAYLKFGEKSFEAEHVRHLNGDPLDNGWDNIALGTQSDNMMDRPILNRQAHAQKAGKAASPYTDELWEQVKADYAAGLGYKKLRKKYGIPLGTLSYQLSKTAGTRALDSR